MLDTVVTMTDSPQEKRLSTGEETLHTRRDFPQEKRLSTGEETLHRRRDSPRTLCTQTVIDTYDFESHISSQSDMDMMLDPMMTMAD